MKILDLGDHTIQYDVLISATRKNQILEINYMVGGERLTISFDYESIPFSYLPLYSLNSGDYEKVAKAASI